MRIVLEVEGVVVVERVEVEEERARTVRRGRAVVARHASQHVMGSGRQQPSHELPGPFHHPFDGLVSSVAPFSSSSGAVVAALPSLVCLRVVVEGVEGR